jgi:polysaccharide pyruvyl transferase WcaK-like protein
LIRLAGKIGEVLRFGRGRTNRNPTLEWIRNSDLAVSVGGVVFDTLGTKLDEVARLLIRVLPLLAAQKIGIPSVMVGAQVGPFGTRFGRLLCRSVFARAAALFPRDRISAHEVEKYPAHRLMPDSAFALDFPPSRNADLLARRGLDPNAATLALVISSAIRPDERRDDYLSLFATVARRLLDAGLVTQIVIVRQSDEDRAISLDLAQRLKINSRAFIDDDLSPEELSNLYGSCRMVVSSRLHAVILALLAGARAVSLAPELTFKERSVLEIVGLDSLWVPTRGGAERAAAACLAIASENERHFEIEAAVAAARAQWNEIPPLLRQLVEKARVG